MVLFLTLFFTLLIYSQKLTITNNTFSYSGQNVFLSGVNQPWLNYARDFGNSQSNGVHCTLVDYLRNISNSGGNSVRFWLFIDGSSIPAFNNQGHVTGTDGSNSLIDDMRHYLHAAQKFNIFVFFVLWNGAANIDQNEVWKLNGLIVDDSKLTTFLQNALAPMVKALKDEPALGGWEIMNEPEGSIAISSNPEPCWDTSGLGNAGAGWCNQKWNMKDIQSFIAKQAQVIHAYDPKVLVTSSSWSEHSATDQFGNRNYYSNNCLKKSSGLSSDAATLDFFQIHTYEWQGKYNSDTPFHHKASDFELSKPVMIGEFASGSLSSPQQYEYAFQNGYAGGWGWSAIGGDGNDDLSVLSKGMSAIQNRPGVSVNLPSARYDDTCNCSDNPPSHDYTCAQQASWGQCGQSWMKGFCCKSCSSCKGCT